MTRIFIILFTFLIPLALFSQNIENNDQRSENRRFADSLYRANQKKQEKETRVNNNLDNKKPRSSNHNPARSSNHNPERFIINIDQEEENGKPLFSHISNSICPSLYDNTWCTNKVKMQNFHFGEFPDELIVKLIDKKKKRNFHFPCNGQVSSPYGWRWNRPHGGVDFALKIGEPIYAVFDGVVRVAQINGGYGKMILIRHYNNLETLYAHLDKINVKVGQEVKAGDIIGMSGNTGFSTGPHLHFETRLLYQTFDPEWILSIENKSLKAEIIKVEKTYFGIERAEKQRKHNRNLSSLTKVNKTLPGKPYIPFKPKNTFINPNLLAQGGDEPLDEKGFYIINNDDKTTWRYIYVKKGDTISKIAEKYRVTPKQINEMNSLKDGELIENLKIRIR